MRKAGGGHRIPLYRQHCLQILGAIPRRSLRRGGGRKRRDRCRSPAQRVVAFGTVDGIGGPASCLRSFLSNTSHRQRFCISSAAKMMVAGSTRWEQIAQAKRYMGNPRTLLPNDTRTDRTHAARPCCSRYQLNGESLRRSFRYLQTLAENISARKLINTIQLARDTV